MQEIERLKKKVRTKGRLTQRESLWLIEKVRQLRGAIATGMTAQSIRHPAIVKLAVDDVEKAMADSGMEAGTVEPERGNQEWAEWGLNLPETGVPNDEVIVVCQAGQLPAIYVNEVCILRAEDTGPVAFQHNTEAHNPAFEAAWHSLSRALGSGYVILNVSADADVVETIRSNKALRAELGAKA